MKSQKKYVVVLAHADGWGAISANRIVRHLHEQYPDVDVHLVVSRATKSKKTGEILTKLEELRLPRRIKETDLETYFDEIDRRYAQMTLTPPPHLAEHEARGTMPASVHTAEDIEYYIRKGQVDGKRSFADLLTFNELSRQCCADGVTHYTTCGGPRGGAEVAEVVKELEASHGGRGPEVLLSVDTMAILPKELLEKYQCFSTHPGPLDTVKVEGMQGTLRSLTHHVLYDADGKPLTKRYGPLDTLRPAYVKGTLFMQHPELDKGPAIRTVLAPIAKGMSAYRVRDEVFHTLTGAMMELMPQLLDSKKRSELVAEAQKKKDALDKKKHTRIDELETPPLEQWQEQVVGVNDERAKHGVSALCNQLIDPGYFSNAMRRFFPGNDAEFAKAYEASFGEDMRKLEEQQMDAVSDPWARLAMGDKRVTINRYDPRTGEVIGVYHNR